MLLHKDKKQRISSEEMDYQDIKLIGEGTFGKVYVGTRGGRQYALKHYSYSSSLVHATTVREIRALRALNHPNIISIKEIIVHKYSIYVVFPLGATDLSRLVHGRALKPEGCRVVLQKILLGLEHMHERGIIHRDIKSANILVGDGANHQELEQIMEERVIGSSTSVRICDFGMARRIEGDATPGLVTLWYRPPELLLGCVNYKEEVDVWSAGCILFETAMGKALFKGNSEVEQLEHITAVCGTIDKLSMPQIASYPLYGKILLPAGERIIRRDFPMLPDSMVDLLDRMLVLDPQQRISVKEALKHPFLIG